MSPGFLIIHVGSSLTSQLEGCRQKCYHIQRHLNCITFLWWSYQYWCCVSDYQPRSWRQQVHSAS